MDIIENNSKTFFKNCLLLEIISNNCYYHTMPMGIGGFMKNVLCFGDSNTWGYNPIKGGERHLYKDRWTTHLQSYLGEDYLIIPEGLNGRTTVWDDPVKGEVNGKKYLKPCLESHKPIDLVIIMLGTNDLKAKFNLPSVDIAAGVGVLIDIVKDSKCGPDNKAPELLILIPPEVRKLSNFKEVFGDCHKKSKEFPRVYGEMATVKGVNYIDIGQTVRFSDADGIHYEVQELEKLGRLVGEFIKKST